MHASSLENMQKYHDRYVIPATATFDTVSVVDVGGADVNGGYRQVFTDPRYEYRTVDIEPGEGVDIVLDDPYVLPIEDSTVDVVLSGQMLEHCEFFWLTFAEMVRVLKPSGIIVLIAPSAGPIHRFPVDCYRFYPDAYRALAKWTRCHVVELFHDERGPWNDLVGVFSRTPMAAALPPQTRTYVPPIDARPPDAPGSAEEEQVRGEQHYLDFLSRLHAAVRPSLYLEIGVRFGRSLALADGLAVGVDPEPDLRFDLGSNTRVWTGTSDEFFESADQDWLPCPVDLAFLDGMHLFEYVLRDFMNAERRSRPGATIVIDDVFPVHPAQAARSRRTRVWTGDVWKIDAILARYRPDLVRIRVDTEPTGLLLVVGADPENRLLWQQYNPIVRAFSEDLPVPEDMLDRAEALLPTSPQVADALALIADRELRRPELIARLRNLLTTSQR